MSAIATAVTLPGGNVTGVSPNVKGVTITYPTDTDAIFAAVTAASDTVIGAAARVSPYPFEDSLCFRHADDNLLDNDEGTASLDTSGKRRGLQSQSWPPVNDGQHGVAVDVRCAWEG